MVFLNSGNLAINIPKYPAGKCLCDYVPACILAGFRRYDLPVLVRLERVRDCCNKLSLDNLAARRDLQELIG